MNNLYIALSTHHLKYCEKIASQNKTANNILVTSKNFDIDTACFSRIIFLSSTTYNQSASFGSKLNNIIKKTATYRKVVNELKDIKNEENLTLYYSSLEDILSNYLLFYFSKTVKGIIIEDGVLNYYEHNLNDVSSVNFNLKKAISYGFGLKLKSYKGHTSGIDYEKVRHQLVREPKYAIRPEKSKTLLREKRTVFSLNDNILIVGQESYGSIFSLDFYMNKLLKLIELIKSDKGFSTERKVFYKPHRHGPRIDVAVIAKSFEENKFSYIEEEISMEDLYFNIIRCKNIYTFDSSAVFSIYADSPLEIKEKLNITVMPFYKSDLNSLFAKLNFTVHWDGI